MGVEGEGLEAEAGAVGPWPPLPRVFRPFDDPPPQGEDGVSPSLKYRMVVFFNSVSLNSIS
jgi:hypothetical protein